MNRLLTLCPTCADTFRKAGYLLWPQSPDKKRFCDNCRKKRFAKNYMVRKSEKA
jgi:hypothetical protein